MAVARCVYCCEQVTALTPWQTAEVLETMPDDVFRLLEEGRIHLVNPERRIALICGSLFDREVRLVTQRASSANSL